MICRVISSVRCGGGSNHLARYCLSWWAGQMGSQQQDKAIRWCQFHYYILWNCLEEQTSAASCDKEHGKVFHQQKQAVGVNHTWHQFSMDIMHYCRSHLLTLTDCHMWFCVTAVILPILLSQLKSVFRDLLIMTVFSAAEFEAFTKSWYVHLQFWCTHPRRGLYFFFCIFFFFLKS